MNKYEQIMYRVNEHYNEALQHFSQDQIVLCALQGSQNYGLETEHSDVDTKLIVVPTFKDIAMNSKPVSTTHVRENNEHIDLKDIRLYIQTFRKQNLNFLEILFTDYAFVNPLYVNQWNRLLAAREQIVRMNPYRSIQSMKGIAMEKYHAMEHPYPSKVDILAKYGYDPKQLHHLLRVEEYISRYLDGVPYKDCLKPLDPEYLIKVKLGLYDLEKAREEADRAIAHITDIAEKAYARFDNTEDPKVNELLDDVQYQIMKIAVKEEMHNV